MLADVVCVVIIARPDFIMMMGYIIAFLYVSNVISRPKALAELTNADYAEIIEVCDAGCVCMYACMYVCM
jgi:hypothetical protein